MSALLAAAVIDWQHGLIPNRLSLSLLLLGLGFSLFDGLPGVYEALQGGAVGGGKEPSIQPFSLSVRLCGQSYGSGCTGLARICTIP